MSFKKIYTVADDGTVSAGADRTILERVTGAVSSLAAPLGDNDPTELVTRHEAEMNGFYMLATGIVVTQVGNILRYRNGKAPIGNSYLPGAA